MKGKNRLSEIEAALSELLSREEERKKEYEKKISDYEVKALEKELEKEAKELKKVYPDFDENKELENEVFVKLMLAGLDMKTAYEAVHLGDIKKAAEKPEKKTARPEENGSAGGGSALFKSGVYALSKKDRADLAKRAQKGEIIRF